MKSRPACAAASNTRNGGAGALIQRQGFIARPQEENREALPLEFMPQQAGESERHIFFLQAFC